MKRDTCFILRVNETERQEIERLSQVYNRSMSEAVRLAVSKQLNRAGQAEQQQEQELQPA